MSWVLYKNLKKCYVGEFICKVLQGHTNLTQVVLTHSILTIKLSH